jgi:hypothetical protein
MCFPSCDQVYDNGTPLGYPVNKKSVAVGMHKLKLVNGTGKDAVTKVISTSVEADKETKERVSMTP